MQKISYWDDNIVLEEGEGPFVACRAPTSPGPVYRIEVLFKQNEDGTWRAGMASVEALEFIKKQGYTHGWKSEEEIRPWIDTLNGAVGSGQLSPRAVPKGWREVQRD